MNNYFWLLIIVPLLVACGIAPASSGTIAENYKASVSNGESIYFNATSERGTAITYTEGPDSGMMMRGNLTCADCHGSDGRGGQRTIHMSTIDAPDIRWSALASEEEDEHGHEDEHEDEHAEAHAGYDLETFRLAVVEGKHPNGDSLSRDMPRWQMSNEDLADLAEYAQYINVLREITALSEYRETQGVRKIGLSWFKKRQKSPYLRIFRAFLINRVRSGTPPLFPARKALRGRKTTSGHCPRTRQQTRFNFGRRTNSQLRQPQRS